MIGTIFSLLVTLLPQIFAATGIIPPQIATLIANLGLALPGLVASLTAGQGPTDVVLSILQALKTEFAALRTSGVLSVDQLQMLDSLDSALTQALEGYADAEIETDPSKLTELPTDLTPVAPEVA